MDYWKHWSLESPPFTRRSDTLRGYEHFFLGTPQREAIARLHYLIGGQLDCGLIMAQSGCGLSTLLSHVSRSTGVGDTAIETVMTRGVASDECETWLKLASQLRINASAGSAAREVLTHAGLLSRQGVRLVWLMDACDDSAASVARRMLDADASVTVVLGVQPEQAREVCAEVGQCPLRIDLSPLSLEDTAGYMRWALNSVRLPHSAEGHAATLFTDTALVRLHELSEGRIGWVGRIAELALMIGGAHRLKRIDVDLLESVQAELVRAA